MEKSFIGEVAKYSCNENYYLAGVKVRQCLNNGSWSDAQPECLSKVNFICFFLCLFRCLVVINLMKFLGLIQCSKLNSPRNGRLIYANEHGRIDDDQLNYSMGTFVEVQCENETMVKGDGFLSCIDSGTWDLPVPECVPIPIPTTTSTTTTAASTTISMMMSTTTMVKTAIPSATSMPEPSTAKSIFKPTARPTQKPKPIVKQKPKAKPKPKTLPSSTPRQSVETKTVATQQFDTIPAVISTRSEIQTQSPNLEPSTTIAPKSTPFKVNALPHKNFWHDLKQLYYHGCNDDREMKPLLCALLKNPSNYTDLTLFELPDSSDFKHMDQNLLTHLAHANEVLNSKPEYQLNVESLFPFILYGGDESAQKRMPSTVENAYRFVLCLYIDTILFDRNLNVSFLQKPPPNDDNITQKLKYYIMRVASKAFDQYIQTDYQNKEVSINAAIESTSMMNSIPQSGLLVNEEILTDLTSSITNAPDITKIPLILENEEQFSEQNTALRTAAVLESESVDEACQLENLPDTTANSYISEIKTENEVLFKMPDRLVLIGPVSIRTRAYVECKEGFKIKPNQTPYFECNEQLKWSGKQIECEGIENILDDKKNVRRFFSFVFSD